MEKTKKKKKVPWQQGIMLVIMMLAGGLCGFGLASYLDRYITANEDTGIVLIFAIFIVGLYLAVLIQIIIHEGGHFVFGRLTGYRFSSFRIGSLMLIKEDGKMKMKRLSLAGTGGQCLMEPPELVDGKIPYVLYNLGGSVLNIIAGILSIIIYVLLPDGALIGMFFFCMGIMGFAFAVMNGVPMRLGTVDNDGYNALSLGKHPDALRSFWVQMKANEQISKGKRLKDMPAEWFEIPSEEGMKNSMTAVLGVYACNRLMDEHRFEEAKDLMEHLLHMGTAIVGLHRSLMTCDLIYCELIGEKRKERIEALMDKNQKKFMKSMKKFPGVIRTEYVYALLGENDMDKGEKLKLLFEKIAKTYPYPSDIQSERELMEIAERK